MNKCWLIFVCLFSCAWAQTPNNNADTRAAIGSDRICHVDGTKYAGLSGINACINSFNTQSPGLTIIPASTPKTERHVTPPNGSAVIDLRFANDRGLNEGALPHQHSHVVLDFHAGANDEYENNRFSGPIGLSIYGFADAGGTSGENAKANVVGLYSSVTRNASSHRPVWGTNFSVQYKSDTSQSVAIGTEIDINNSASSPDTHNYGTALKIISGGAQQAGSAIHINSSNPNDAFSNGMIMNNYTANGILFSAGQPRSHDIAFIPPANDSGAEMQGFNSNASQSIWKMEGNGNFSTKGSIHSAVLQNDQGAPCGPSHVNLGPGWGRGGSVRAFSGYSQTCQFVIVSGDGSFSAAPALTYTFATAFSAPPVCTLDVHAKTGRGVPIMFDNTTQSPTAPVFTAASITGEPFTPGPGETYKVVLRCGP